MCANSGNTYFYFTNKYTWVNQGSGEIKHQNWVIKVVIPCTILVIYLLWEPRLYIGCFKNHIGNSFHCSDNITSKWTVNSYILYWYTVQYNFLLMLTCLHLTQAFDNAQVCSKSSSWLTSLSSLILTPPIPWLPPPTITRPSKWHFFHYSFHFTHYQQHILFKLYFIINPMRTTCWLVKTNIPLSIEPIRGCILKNSLMCKFVVLHFQSLILIGLTSAQFIIWTNQI